MNKWVNYKIKWVKPQRFANIWVASEALPNWSSLRQKRQEADGRWQTTQVNPLQLPLFGLPVCLFCSVISCSSGSGSRGPRQPRDIIPPACPWSALRSPPGGTFLKPLPREASSPEPAQLAPLLLTLEGWARTPCGGNYVFCFSEDPVCNPEPRRCPVFSQFMSNTFLLFYKSWDAWIVLRFSWS